MATLEIWPEALTGDDDAVTAAATLEWPGGPGRFRLWYRFPASFRATFSGSGDPFVQAAIFTAMRTASRMVVHGRVSPSLLRNLEEFQAAWAGWRPALYRKVEIAADAECEQAPAAGNTAVMAFSGGADSAFTAWRHRAGEAGRGAHDLRAGVLVHGFDIPLTDTVGYDGAFARSAAMLASLDIPLFRAATNFRDLQEDWEDVHGAGLASALALLQGQYRSGLIAASYPYAALVLPYGSNPLTDVMLSSDSFRIIHDGAAFNRLEKLRALVRWPEAMKHMRVCWQHAQQGGNCCRCQKCVTNMLYLRMLGQRHPECFPHDIRDTGIMRIKCKGHGMIESMERVLKAARQEKVADSWVAALRICIGINRIRCGWRRLRGR